MPALPLRHRSPRLAVRLVLGATAIVASLVVGGMPPPAHADIVLADRLPRISPEAIAAFGEKNIVPPSYYDVKDSKRNNYVATPWTGTIVLLPEARQLWQVHPLLNPANGFEVSPTMSGIVVRNLDTLKVERTFTMPSMLRGTHNAGREGDWMHTVDGSRRAFFIDRSEDNLLEVDLKTFKVTVRPLPPPVGGATSLFNFLGGITYDPASQTVVAIIGETSVPSTGFSTFIQQFPLDGSAAPQPRLIQSCTGPTPSADGSVGNTLALPVLLTKEHVYVTCQRSGYTAIVVRLPRASAFAAAGGPELAIAGPVYIEAAMVDSAAERIFVVTNLGEIWVFDAATMSFIGVIASSAAAPSTVYSGYGIDEATGRVFFQSATYGFGVIEGRFFPVPQARTVPAARQQGSERIWSDAVTGKVFVLPGVRDDRPLSYAVYQQDAAPRPPALPDPDRNTADIDEQEGKTESKFYSSGTGYGMRVILAKGVSTVPPAVSAGLQSTGQIINDHVNSKCGYTDRELVAGRVSKAEYDTGSTAASAIAVGVDERTEVDLEQLNRCDATVTAAPAQVNQLFATGPVVGDKSPGWNRDPAACSSSVGDPDGKKVANGDDHDQEPMGTSRVECPIPQDPLLAFAEADMRGAVAGKVRTDTKIERTPGKVQAKVVSSASDVSIASVVTIGEIRATAISTSTGRPQKGNMSTYELEMRDVAIAGKTICGSACDPKEVAAELNRAGLGRVEFRAATGLDDRLLAGTPKGALTAVQKSVARQASDRALVGDFTSEVPGFEMVVYNDNTEYGRARQIYQFAGVSTVATYNIVPAPGFTEFPDIEDGPDADDSGDDLAPLPSTSEGGAVVGEVASIADPAATIELAGREGGGIPSPSEILRAIGRGIRLFFTSPRFAGLVLTGWSLFLLPPFLSRRRRLLAMARSA